LSLLKMKTMENSAKGTIYIVDISGYSNFVKKTAHNDGARIVPDLLNAIIRANNLSLRISEIEGDAILFYHFGPAYRVNDILSQFERMLVAFNQEIKSLEARFPQVTRLSIKLVAHYGEISNFFVGGFYKLYGQTLVEAHRLLKNNIGLNTYALITEEYTRAQAEWYLDSAKKGTDFCEIYNVGKICYTYYPYTALGFTRCA